METSQVKNWAAAASLENVDLICAEMTVWLEERELYRELFALEILAREALNNAVFHGNRSDPSKKVQAEIKHDAESVSIKVSDEGPGFNWRECLKKEEVNDNRENGRGLTLYQLYADKVEFNESGNEVILIRLVNSRKPSKSFQDIREGK
jgi:serine/threonine-protein kinase RsbW